MKLLLDVTQSGVKAKRVRRAPHSIALPNRDKGFHKKHRCLTLDSPRDLCYNGDSKMPSRSKDIGDRWEREVVKELKGRRQPNSGAFGTLHNDASLTGDVLVEYPWLSRLLHIECKYGYGGSKSLSLKRDWIAKVREEAKRARRYAALALKFRGVTGGDRESARLICFDLETWKAIAKEIEYLYLDYLNLLKEDYERKENEN